jgi:hypothetical protein
MRTGLLSSMVTLAIAVALGAAAHGATAATLYTDWTLSSTVTPGTTANASTYFTPVGFANGTTSINSCPSSALTTTVSGNAFDTVTLTVTAGTFTGCSPLAVTGTFTTPWEITITGPATTVGSVTRWVGFMTNVAFTMGGNAYSGTVTSGVTAQQTDTDGLLCLTLTDAGRWSGSATTNGRFTTKYCLTGAAAAYVMT